MKLDNNEMVLSQKTQNTKRLGSNRKKHTFLAWLLNFYKIQHIPAQKSNTIIIYETKIYLGGKAS